MLCAVTLGNPHDPLWSSRLRHNWQNGSENLLLATASKTWALDFHTTPRTAVLNPSCFSASQRAIGPNPSYPSCGVNGLTKKQVAGLHNGCIHLGLVYDGRRHETLLSLDALGRNQPASKEFIMILVGPSPTGWPLMLHTFHCQLRCLCSAAQDASTGLRGQGIGRQGLASHGVDSTKMWG